jgi:hypothetical protein
VLASYGCTYSPSKPELSISNLQTVLQNSKQALLTVHNTFTTWKNATNDREIDFLVLRPLSTRLLSALIACGATEQTVNDLRTINRKIQGSHSKLTKADAGRMAGGDTALPTTPGEEAGEIPKHISVSQRSFDSQIDHFEKLIILLNSEARYTPAESDLQITTLQSHLTSFKTRNTAAFSAYTALSNARIARNKILYHETDGLVILVRAVKAYIKSQYGSYSQEYELVNRIKFVKVVRKIR